MFPLDDISKIIIDGFGSRVVLEAIKTAENVEREIAFETFVLAVFFLTV